jgi:polyhydroxybutyrate depolymerase
LLHVPAAAKAGPVPVVFGFHGHGGSASQASRSFPIHELWPEALVVYLQGLPTKGQLSDPTGRDNGWQAAPGAEGDRDLKFFDVVLASLRADYRVDEKRVYATGHSNGGSFTYLLWAVRGDRFAAYAPSGAVAGRAFVNQLRPAPVLQVAGQKDQLVKFAWQERMIGKLRRLNGCGEGQPGEKGTMTYPSATGTPVVTFIYPGDHHYPPQAPALIVDFFKTHPKP